MRIAGGRSLLAAQGKGGPSLNGGPWTAEDDHAHSHSHSHSDKDNGKHRFTSHAPLWDVGGDRGPQRKLMRMWAECVNSAQTLALAGNRFFPHQRSNEMTNEITSFKDPLSVCMDNSYIIILKLNNYLKSHKYYGYMLVVELQATYKYIE